MENLSPVSVSYLRFSLFTGICIFHHFYISLSIFCRYVGRLMVKSSSKPIDIVGQLNKMAGFAPDEEIDLFEVRAGAL